MQILVPISGRSAFFPKSEYYFPKPLVEVAGLPMTELVVSQLKRRFDHADFVFVVDREDARAFSLDRTLELVAGPGTKIVEKLGETSGALCSCLLAVDALDLDKPLIISNSDQIVTESIEVHVEAFMREGATAGVLTFDSVHPRWSYVLEGERGEVVQTFEKRVVSRHAIAGLYYFATARDFVEAAQRSILNDASIEGRFFISSALNEVILAGGTVRHSPIDGRNYHSFYAPDRIAAFERTPLAARLRGGASSVSDVNVIIPAAGEGSRFAKAGWKKPKPFIDLMGKPVLRHVIDNVTPPGAHATLLLRKAHVEASPEIVREFSRSGVTIQPVEKLTEGTACTVLLARRLFDNDRPMMVANSDQMVDFDVSDFIRDCLSRGLDGSILVFRDPALDPKWSFARVDVDGHVVEVAEKKPISDLATVGIYLFARGRDFVSAAADMIAVNDRVNGEFYTCPIYNYMIASGARIGVYEVPMDAMHGLGTPEDLSAYLERNGAPASSDAPDGEG